jgi:PAS domain S-box-containing protein
VTGRPIIDAPGSTGDPGRTSGVPEASAPGDAVADLFTPPPRQRDLQTEQRYRDVLNGLAEGVVETTPAGDFLNVNQAFARMLGYDSGEDLIEHVATAADLAVRPENRPALLRRIAASPSELLDVELRRRDGSSLWVRIRATSNHAPDGELASVLTIVADLTESRASVRALHDASATIETRERSLLAEAVHDDPLQLVIAAILRIDGLQAQVGTAHSEVLEQIATILEQAVDGLRQLIVALNPPDLADGLGVALMRLAQGIFLGTTTQLRVTGSMHVPLPVPTKNNAYRLLREALVNVRRHAGATHVVIGLEPRLDCVVLTVSDDGIGSDDLLSGRGHMGMATMRARADDEGAELVITSRPGHGTTVTLTVPLPPRET